jgi:hypothetical protein
LRANTGEGLLAKVRGKPYEDKQSNVCTNQEELFRIKDLLTQSGAGTHAG